MSYSREQLEDFSRKGGESAEVFAQYMEYYRIEVPEGGTAYWDRTGVDSHTAIYVYAPAAPKKTVILLHGYITHSGTATFLIRELLDQGYRVVCADLPGHGLSDGEMCDINDFCDYGEYMRELVSYCKVRFEGGIDFVAHSTGCAVGVEYLRQGGTDIDRMVFISPLVRSYLWDLSWAGMAVLDIFSDRFPALRPDATSDKEFNAIIDQDPLRNGFFPYHWVRELDEWNKRLNKDTLAFDIPLLVMYGSNDTVVDVNYGKKYFGKSFTDMDLIMIKDGIHNMHCDKESIRSLVFGYMSEFLITPGNHLSFL